MKINNEGAAPLASPGIKSAELERSQRLDRYRQPASASPTASDEVELSGLTTTILKAGETRAAEQSTRVEALGAAYRAGRYVVESQQLGPKLVDAWLTGGVPKKE